ncbi:PCI domain-containing protein [Cryptosporidium andersoni]|uniref:PCI domain-containing protein n=1 Tax=Cryptosporidium andersoni TaxID=117008 RepID=A0A1J4MK65_9CRYT|nr:PCI domain-containing protein [Cryptosporidium andersoni]
MQFVFTLSSDIRSVCIIICDWLLVVVEYLNRDKYTELYTQVCNLIGQEEDIDLTSVYNLISDNIDYVFEILDEFKERKEIIIKEDKKRSFNELYKESEEFFIFLLSLLINPKFDTKQLEDCKSKFLGKIINNNNIPMLSINVLQMYYDVLGPNYEVLTLILEYSIKNKNTEKVITSLEKIDKHISTWNLDKDQLRFLYSQLYEVISINEYSKFCEQSPNSIYLSYTAYKYLRTYCETFSEKEEIESRIKDEDFVPKIIKFLISSILLPDILFFDSVLELPSVIYIKDNFIQYSVLIQLCEICLNGKVGHFYLLKNSNSEYKKLISQYPVLEEYESNIIDKLQLLTISSLAQLNSCIRLEELQSEFNLSSFDTQDVVVKAISVGLIDGSIDENDGSVNINSITKRQFGKAEWQNLEKKLNKWIDYLNELTNILSSSNQNE